MLVILVCQGKIEAGIRGFGDIMLSSELIAESSMLAGYLFAQSDLLQKESYFNICFFGDNLFI